MSILLTRLDVSACVQSYVLRYILACLSLCVAGIASGQTKPDSSVSFWTAVTPKGQAFDQAKMERCLELIKNLPPNSLDLHPTITCPTAESIKSGGATPQNFDHWIREAFRLRRLGYKDCSLSILHNLVDLAPAPEMKLTAYTELIYTHITNLEYHKADTLAVVAMKLAKEHELKHIGILYAAAFSNHRNRKTETAREQVGEALELARKKGDKHLEMRILSLMGIINRDVFFGHSLKAIPDHSQALDIAKSLKDTTFIMNELLALGFNYGDAGNFNLHFDYLNEALEYLQYHESVLARIRIESVICERLEAEKRMEESRRLREEAVRLAELAHTLYAADIYRRLFGLYMELKQPDKAKIALDKAKAAFDEAGVTGADMVGIEQSYYHYAKLMGRPEEALKHLEAAFTAVSESYMQRNAELLSRLETQYRTGEKEKLLQTTRRQRTWVIALACLITVLGGFVYVSYLRQRKTSRLLADQNETIQRQSEELKSLEELKSRFFANVSHELRTPLTLMLGPLDSLLKKEVARPENEQRLLQFVQKNSRQLLKLVNEILDLSKLETGRLEVKEEAINFHQFLQPLVTQFSSAGDTDSAVLRLEYLADPKLRILLDLGKFEKIVHNFLSNALKFTPPGGHITLVVEDQGESLLVTVRDTGPGIHPNDMPHIFDRFYQSRQPDAPIQGGTGIGLSLVKELAELLGGKVWAESPEPGKGSSFYFQFPKKTVESLPPAPSQGEGDMTSAIPSLPPSEGVGGRLSTILIVEDNPELREYMEVLLGDEYEIITAENGKVAWEWLTADGGRDTVESLPPTPSKGGGERDAHRQPLTIRRLPDLIISDLMMPIMDGFTLLEKVKGHDALRHLPVIMLTARTDMRVKLRALRIGVDDYLTKPFVEEELKVRIQNLLHNYRQRLVAMTEPPEPDEAVPLQAEKPLIGAADAAWLEEVETLFSKKLADTQFKMEWVAQEVHLSERQFNRRLKQLTGLTPNHYLREIRLQTARDLLHAGKYTSVKEVSFAIGFLDTTYFSRLFKERFGAFPSEYLS